MAKIQYNRNNELRFKYDGHDSMKPDELAAFLVNQLKEGNNRFFITLRVPGGCHRQEQYDNCCSALRKYITTVAGLFDTQATVRVQFLEDRKCACVPESVLGQRVILYATKDGERETQHAKRATSFRLSDFTDVDPFDPDAPDFGKGAYSRGQHDNLEDIFRSIASSATPYNAGHGDPFEAFRSRVSGTTGTFNFTFREDVMGSDSVTRSRTVCHSGTIPIQEPECVDDIPTIYPDEAVIDIGDLLSEKRK